jgi:hypothetical protein
VKTATDRARFPGARMLSDGRALYWWAELLAIIVFYVVYSAVRNLHGGGAIPPLPCNPGAQLATHLPPHACDHARQVMSFEHHLGLYHEQTFQEWAQHFRPLIIGANYFYGSFHFIVTIFAGIFLYRRYSDDYPRFRNTLAITTAIALIGFTFYPLAPPRMFPGFVDTLAKDPAFWSFNSGGMQSVSNQFAAMPSVHIAWATWCAFALAPRLKNRVASVLAAAYPFITLVVIVITANHYIVDAVGGWIILALGWVIAHRITRAGRAPTSA